MIFSSGVVGSMESILWATITGPIVLVCKWWVKDWKELVYNSLCESRLYPDLMGDRRTSL